EAAVLPLNYTRNETLDFRFSIARLQPEELRMQFGSFAFDAAACAISRIRGNGKRGLGVR
ncbi:MAG TPA: hypothetical protein VFQ78_07760, partial [Candidatus Udaeobacter sp.]|nr:hypothetical protein [Candidatus Udaeobacter sp.]